MKVPTSYLRRLILCAAAIVLPMSQALMALPASADSPSAWITSADPAFTQNETTTLPDRTENELCGSQSLTASVASHGVPSTQSVRDCVVQTDYGVVGQEFMVLGTSNLALKLEAPGTPVLVPHTSRLVLRTESGMNGQYLRMFDHPIAQFSRQISSSAWGISYKTNSPADWTATDASGQPLLVDAVASSANGEWLVLRAGTKLIRLNMATRTLLTFTEELPDYSTYPKLGVNLGVSNDGRYVAYSGANVNTLTLYDLAPCGSAAGCGRRDLTAFMQAHVPEYRDSRYFAFGDDGSQITFYNTAAAGTKLYRAVLTSAVYMPPPRLDYLGLGDSFSSGEGEVDNYYYVPGSDGDGVFQPGIRTQNEKCHISTRSYPFLLKRQMGINDNSSAVVACSGAKGSDILATGSDYIGQFNSLQDLSPAQRETAKNTAVSQLVAGRAAQIAFVGKYKPRAITITIGGNDLGFGAKLQACATSLGTCPWANQSPDRSAFAAEIRSQFEPLQNLYSTLQKASTETKIYAVGYPQFFADPTTMPACRDSNSGMIDAAERKFIRESVSYVNAVIKAAAAASGVTYVDIEHSLDGKEICSDGADRAVNGIELGNDIFGLLGNESYHPNPTGHALVSEAIRQKVGNLLNHDCSCQPAGTQVPVIPVFFLIDGVGLATPKLTPLSPTQQLQKDLPMTLQVTGRQLAPGTHVTFEIHSDTQTIGTDSTDINGDFSHTLTLPASLPVGIHTIHAIATAPSGEQIDLYQPIIVSGSSSDTDGDGIPNQADACLLVQAKNLDSDHDGIDDGCDGHIGEPALPPSPLYSVRSGVPAKNENPKHLYVERNIAQAALQLGLSGDYDPDDDGWAIVGHAATQDGRAANFWIDSNHVPHVSTRTSTAGCIQLTPANLTVVQKKGARPLITEAEDTNTCRSAPPNADTDHNGQPDNTQPLYRLRLDGGGRSNIVQLFIERSTASAEAQLGKSDYDANADGWAIVGQTRAAGSSVRLYIEDEAPYVLLGQKKQGCIALAPKSLATVTRGSHLQLKEVRVPPGAACR